MRDVYEFIKSFMKERGYTPTIREICEGVGYKSTSSGQKEFDKLVKQGLIERHGDRYSLRFMKYVEVEK